MDYLILFFFLHCNTSTSLDWPHLPYLGPMHVAMQPLLCQKVLLWFVFPLFISVWYQLSSSPSSRGTCHELILLFGFRRLSIICRPTLITRRGFPVSKCLVFPRSYGNCVLNVVAVFWYKTRYWLVGLTCVWQILKTASPH